MKSFSIFYDAIKKIKLKEKAYQESQYTESFYDLSLFLNF